MNKSRHLWGSPPAHFSEHACEAFEDLGQTQTLCAKAPGLERAALANPDLPVSFAAESLMSLAEAREDSLAFVPRSQSALRR